MSTSPKLPDSRAKHFSAAKAEFDKNHATASRARCIVPVNGKVRASAPIRDAYGKPSEEYYKWQFIYSRINSGLYAPDYVAVEVQFPKGNTAVLASTGQSSTAPNGLSTTTPIGGRGIVPTSNR
jgi:hypothetical protein